MNNKEIEIFLEFFFLYKWTKLKEDFFNLKIAKKFLSDRDIKKNSFLKSFKYFSIDQSFSFQLEYGDTAINGPSFFIIF